MKWEFFSLSTAKFFRFSQSQKAGYQIKLTEIFLNAYESFLFTSFSPLSLIPSSCIWGKHMYININQILQQLFNTFIHSFIHLFMAVLGLCCCAWAFSSCGERGLLFIKVHRLLIVVAPLVAEHGPQARRLQQLWHVRSLVVSCRLQSAGSVVVAQGLSCSAACGNPPGPGLEPESPELAGRFLTTVPPGKSQHFQLINQGLRNLAHQ